VQPSECGTLSFDADGFRFKTRNGPQLIAFVFVFETTPASEGGRYMACIRTKGIEARILIPAERKRILTEALQYDSQPPEIQTGKYRWNRGLNAGTTG